MLLRIKFLRLTLRLSQKQVAKKVGIPRQYISHLENGWRNPSDRERTVIARLLGCTPEQCRRTVSGYRSWRTERCNRGAQREWLETPAI